MTRGADPIERPTGAAPIERVVLGRSGLELTRLVLGCAPLGGLFAPVAERVAAHALEAAWEEGIRAFDTAPHYGVGLSEERLGAFVAGKARDEVVVSTKVGRLLVATDEDVDGLEGFYGTPRRVRVRDYSRAGTRRSIEQSCERLGLERVDVALIHDPDAYSEIAFAETYPALEELRAEGTVRAIGVGMNHVELLERFVATTDIDCILVAGRYSLLDHRAAERLFPACLDRGVAVIAGGVYNSGILADPRPSATYDYQPASKHVRARVEALRTVCERHGVPLARAAIHYVLAHPAVTAVVVGARSSREVRENAVHARAEVPGELFDELVAEGLVGPASGARAR